MGLRPSLATATTDDDGLDIGWVSTSEAGMSVKHHFSGVAKGQNYIRCRWRDGAMGTDKALAMDARRRDAAGQRLTRTAT